MSIDLSRPLAPLPPRLTDYTVVCIAWVVCFVLAVGLDVLGGFPPSAGTFFLSAILVLVSLGIALYLSVRIGWRALVYSWVTDLRKYPPIGGVEMDGRYSDVEEIRARRSFRKGRISRVEYERRIAYRRFVHGEISRAEYHSLLQQVETTQEASPRK